MTFLSTLSRTVLGPWQEDKISFVWINHLDLIKTLKLFILDIFTDIPFMGKGSELKP